MITRKVAWVATGVCWTALWNHYGIIFVLRLPLLTIARENDACRRAHKLETGGKGLKAFSLEVWWKRWMFVTRTKTYTKTYTVWHLYPTAERLDLRLWLIHTLVGIRSWFKCLGFWHSYGHHIEFWGPGFSLAQTQMLWATRRWISRWTISSFLFSLLLSPSSLLSLLFALSLPAFQIR